MKPTLNEKFIAYLALLSGLSISAVAVYYSVVGLTAIFAGAVVPIVIMGASLEISKLIVTVWLKQNWTITPALVKAYLLTAIAVLMVITSMGIFGFLSKAHLDQGLGSSEVAAKIAVYDEKIKTAKENIDANRKALKQMDEAVDQSMARSTSETGADKAVAIRKGQAKERARLQADIAAEQKTISSLNEERAPIAAEVRKVEAEVGPIKYIAAFFYDATDATVLEKAVTWVIIILIIVFDPLAVMLLLASQISFQNFRKREEYVEPVAAPVVVEEVVPVIEETVEEIAEPVIEEIAEEPVITYNELSLDDLHKLEQDMPLFPPNDTTVEEPPIVNRDVIEQEIIERLAGAVQAYLKEEKINPDDASTLFVQNEEQKESNLWSQTTSSEEDQGSDEHRRDVEINKWAKLIKDRQATMKDVPAHMILEVRARV